MRDILLIENDPLSGRGMKLSLELEGYRVFWALDTRSALTMETSRSFGLLILSWDLPDGKAEEFVKLNKEHVNSRPTIFVTTLAPAESQLRQFGPEKADFVRRPFSHADLIARVKTVLRDATPSEGNLHYGGLVLLPRQRRMMMPRNTCSTVVAGRGLRRSAQTYNKRREKQRCYY